jgi:RNA polymerase sigma factor (sigma-70 family)
MCDQEKQLIVLARLGNREAFDVLWRRYEKQIYGYIRARVDNDADAQDLTQETAEKVWRKIPTYSSARGSFFTFIRIWADYKLKAYYEVRNTRRNRERLWSEMHPWNADHDQEEPAPELNETLAREGKEKSVLPEATLIPYEVYDELLRVTFSLENPPHLLIAFGFCWLLEWKSGEVEQELAEIQLSELLKRLEHDICNYLKEQGMAADRLHAHRVIASKDVAHVAHGDRP